MTRKRVLVVIGTRPEGIKLAPVIAALGRRPDGVECRVALTGQHSDLMDQVVEAFGIRADWDLGVMREGQDLYDVLRACLVPKSVTAPGLRDVFAEYRPDLTVVEGDTASVFAAGLVSFFERTRLAHVEAGLRSGDKWRPWPEEIFRRLTGVVADLHFAPTPAARDNLRAENVPASSIHVTGNTVVDALLHAAATPHQAANPDLREALGSGRRLVLLTAHRRESFGKPLRDAFGAIRALADRFEDIAVLYPVHPNPHVREAAVAVLSGHPRIALTQPLGYLDLVSALEHASLVITDSGGIQEEAPTFQKPVLILREVTERPEAVEAGVAELVGTDPRRILALASAVLEGDWRTLKALRMERTRPPGRNGDASLEDEIAAAKAMASRLVAEAYPNPYGDGRAGERIADIIVSALTGAPRVTEDWSGPA